MKKLLYILLFSMTFAKAQDFEGVITWKISMEITDPKTKAQMEEAQKKMSDPKQQAQMKEMMDRMNDPQVKAMMESNPQMKAQLEKALQMAQGGDLTSLVPTGYTIKIKNQNTLVSMEGGMMANTEMLFLKDKNTTYRIDRENKTYSKLPQVTSKQDNQIETKVTKTTETEKILDYTCTKYIVDVTTNGKTMQQYFWTTTAIKGIDFKSLAHQRVADEKQALFYDKVDGLPLKMEMTTPQGSMVMVVTGLKKQSLPASDFTIPSGFKEVASTF